MRPPGTSAPAGVTAATGRSRLVDGGPVPLYRIVVDVVDQDRLLTRGGTLFTVWSAGGRVVAAAGYPSTWNTYSANDPTELHFFTREVDPTAATITTLPKPSGSLRTGYAFGIGGSLVIQDLANRYPSDVAYLQYLLDLDASGEPYPIRPLADSELRSGTSFEARGLRYGWAPGLVQACPVTGDAPCQSIEIDEASFPYAYGENGGVVIAVTNWGEILLHGGSGWCRAVAAGDGFACPADGSPVPRAKTWAGFQFYSSVNYEGATLLGRYPGGLLYEFDGTTLKPSASNPSEFYADQTLPREAQSVAIYCGDLYVGHYPRGEVWTKNLDSGTWERAARLFSYPTEDVPFVPYLGMEPEETPESFYGQRVTSLSLLGGSLFASTSNLREWDAAHETPSFLTSAQVDEYGSIARFSRPGCLTTNVAGSPPSYSLTFEISEEAIRVIRDGATLFETANSGAMPGASDLVQVGDGVFGPFAGATVEARTSIEGLYFTPSTAAVAPRGAIPFAATGGSGTGYGWSLTASPSGGTITAAGVYTAGDVGDTSDVVQLSDSLGAVSVRTIRVGPVLSLSPATVSTAPRARVIFAASGGNGSSRAWSLIANPSGGSVSVDGLYTAGSIGGVSDVVRVVDANGVAATATISVGPGLSLSPATNSSPPRGSLSFTAAGGSGTGYTWSISANPSGGAITSAGVYTAGSTGNVSDVVQVTDSLGNVATRTIVVGPGLSLSPATNSSPPRGSLSFTAAGGSGTGYTWSISANPSGGTITSAGVYTAGSTGNVSDVVQVMDALGNSAHAFIGVGPELALLPSATTTAPKGSISLSARGGDEAAYAWSLTHNPSGGTVTSVGLYTAGPVGNVNDTVQVMDALGNTASFVIGVGPELSLVPSATFTAPKGKISLEARGGNGAAYTWSLAQNASGGTVTSDGLYSAGLVGRVSDVVVVVDANGSEASARISVGPALSLSPATGSTEPGGSVTFSAAGGLLEGHTWSFTENRSGATVTPAGVYVAGKIAKVVDVVQVSDGNGATATASVTVLEPAAIPNWGCSSTNSQGNSGWTVILLVAVAVFRRSRSTARSRTTSSPHAGARASGRALPATTPTRAQNSPLGRC